MTESEALVILDYYHDEMRTSEIDRQIPPWEPGTVDDDDAPSYAEHCK